jgi:hypothetical protein
LNGSSVSPGTYCINADTHPGQRGNSLFLACSLRGIHVFTSLKLQPPAIHCSLHAVQRGLKYWKLKVTTSSSQCDIMCLFDPSQNPYYIH